MFQTQFVCMALCSGISVLYADNGVARIMCQSLRKKEQGVTMTFHP